jgi:hypothetical protein
VFLWRYGIPSIEIVAVSFEAKRLCDAKHGLRLGFCIEKHCPRSHGHLGRNGKVSRFFHVNPGTELVNFVFV